MNGGLESVGALLTAALLRWSMAVNSYSGTVNQ
jgi:hypothetical protein